MRMLKKMIGAVLAVCLIISMIPLAALATGTGTAAAAPGRIMMDQTVLSGGQTTVWIDGVEYTVQGSGGSYYVDLPADADPGALVVYDYHVGDAADVHTQYPTGMQVWALNKNEDGSFTPEKIEDLTNILQYSGSSIRITGNKGIRMITSIERDKKTSLTSAGGLGGYKLLEYGTVLAWSSDLADGDPLVLGPEYAKSNYAYKKGTADPVFAYEGNLMQYTNVLVGFSLDQCKDDIAMRPYMILEGPDGEQMTIYGGIVHRSIGYIAWQNQNVFSRGTAAYNYVWEIIHHVYAQVTFQTNGGAEVASTLVEKGKTLTRPADPAREGYTFAGWYTDEALTEAFDFATVLNEDVTLYAKWLDGSMNLSNFSADETYFLTDYQHSVLFTVEGISITEEVVNIYCNDVNVDVMVDDGTHGDAVAGDGVYSYRFEGEVDQAGRYTYYAQAGAVTSNETTLYYFERPTEENAEQIREEAEEVQDHIDSIEAGYRDDDGFVSLDDVEAAMNDIGAYTQELYDGGEIVWYEVNDSNVIVQMNSGFVFTHMLNIEGVDSIGSDVSMSITTAQPCRGMYGNYSESYISYPDGITNALDMPDVAASSAAATFENYTFTNNYDNGDVTLARIREFSSNQVILWHGHGGYSALHHSFLLTGEDFDWNAWWWDPVYCLNNLRGQFLEAGGRVCITAKYINENCGDMTNSLVYLAACKSGRDSVLADAFLNKGATAVVANSETIYTLYNMTMQYATIRNMCQINEGTGNYNTLSEALTAAKNTYGQDDSVYGTAKPAATPLIFGGSEANNYRFGDVTGILSGKVVKASDGTTPVTEANIHVVGDNATTSLQPDSEGFYNIELPAQGYHVTITADGYIPFNAYANIQGNQTVYMETFLMVEGEETDIGTSIGTITNALTGEGVDGVKLEARAGWNNSTVGDVVETVYTDASGGYTITMPIGNYTLSASKDGFVSTILNIVVMKDGCYVKDISMTPILSGDDYRIVLDWGPNPRDLDAHVYGTLSTGRNFHVYYSNMTARDNGEVICRLDIDNRYSEGPETITLKATSSGPYYYYIHHYAGSSNIPNSGAQVKVYQGDIEIATFNVPTNIGTGYYWNVFAIVDGQIVVRNTMTNSAEVNYAGSNGASTIDVVESQEYASAAPSKETPAAEGSTK